MPATKRMSNVGSWSVKLRDDTPRDVTDRLTIADAQWSHLVLLPGQVEAASVTFNDLLSMSMFTGVYRGRTGRTEFAGAHASIYLGDEQGHGPIRESALTKAAGTFDQWATDIKPSSLNAGSYLTSISTLNWSTIYKTPRQDLDYICDYFTGGALTFGQVYTWQVTDDLTLNVGAPSSFDDRTVVLSPMAGGTDFSEFGVECEFTVNYDAEDYVTKVIADNGSSVGTSSGSSVYDNALGTALEHEAYVNDSDTVAGALSGVAAGQRIQHDAPEWRVSARTPAFAIMANIGPGSAAYCWDIESGLYTVSWASSTLASGIYYRGEVIQPRALYVQALTMPIEDGMGVYLHLADGSDEIIDLSPYVEWERPGATIEVGSPARRLVAPVALSPVRW
jgi:hypothetical protein